MVTWARASEISGDRSTPNNFVFLYLGYLERVCSSPIESSVSSLSIQCFSRSISVFSCLCCWLFTRYLAGWPSRLGVFEQSPVGFCWGLSWSPLFGLHTVAYIHSVVLWPVSSGCLYVTMSSSCYLSLGGLGSILLRQPISSVSHPQGMVPGGRAAATLCLGNKGLSVQWASSDQ